MKSIEIEIVGKKYRFRTDNPGQIKESAAHLNSLLDDITSKYGIIDSKDSLVLAAMDLADKLFQITEESRKLRQEMDELHSKISSFFVDVVEK